jgi:hypothetical protein
LVHDHLADINERLARQGIRTISLTDPEHVERYGLDQLARDRTLELDFDDEAAAEIGTEVEAGTEAGAGTEADADFERDLVDDDEVMDEARVA